MMDYDAIKKNPAFKDLEPERVEMLIELAKRLEGKGAVEALGILSEFSRKFPAGREFTKEERAVMIGAFLESMPRDERVKYESLLKIIGFY